jgi:hypothetical protein
VECNAEDFEIKQSATRTGLREKRRDRSCYEKSLDIYATKRTMTTDWRGTPVPDRSDELEVTIGQTKGVMVGGRDGERERR